MNLSTYIGYGRIFAVIQRWSVGYGGGLTPMESPARSHGEDRALHTACELQCEDLDLLYFLFFSLSVISR